MDQAINLTRTITRVLAVPLLASSLIGCRSGEIGDDPPPLHFAEGLSDLFKTPEAEEQPAETLVPAGMMKLGENDAFVQVVGDRVYCCNIETGQLGSYPRELSEDPVFRAFLSRNRNES